MEQKKAQVTVELISYSIIFLLAFIVVLFVINMYGQHERDSIVFMLVNELNIRFFHLQIHTSTHPQEWLLWVNQQP